MNGEIFILGGFFLSNFNVGGVVIIGLNDFLLFFKDKIVGGIYVYGNSIDEGFIVLVDINSDGLFDKVFCKNEVFWYCFNNSVFGGI